MPSYVNKPHNATRSSMSCSLVVETKPCLSHPQKALVRRRVSEDQERKDDCLSATKPVVLPNIKPLATSGKRNINELNGSNVNHESDETYARKTNIPKGCETVKRCLLQLMFFYTGPFHPLLVDQFSALAIR